MAGALTDLAVAGKLLGRSLSRRVTGELEPPPDLDEFLATMQASLDGALADTVRDYTWLDMSADCPPWVSADMDIAAGDELSWFIDGRVYANTLLDVYIRPALQVWCRMGEGGQVFRGTRNSHSFVADQNGAVQFGNYFPNTWSNREGELAQEEAVYKSNRGQLRILVVRWQGSALAGLRASTAGGDENPWLVAEIERLEQGDTTPEGWHYLWHIGPAEIFRASSDPQGQPCMQCRTHEDVGILQKDVDLPLTPDTEFSWRWCVDELPSTLREDTVPSHDYLSIAVEFDNGRDITYYWSGALPEGTGYDCPLPNWRGIEYHVVVRSGRERLGEWLAERRNLYEDYRRYMGEPPARITQVWFIAVSIFQRGQGRCAYADIQLHGKAGSLRLL